MENGGGMGGYDVAEKLSGLKLGFQKNDSQIENEKDKSTSINDDTNNNNNNSSSLFQVMKAVEAAEATIKQQVEENNFLRAQLQHNILLLDRYKLEEPMSQRSRSYETPSVGTGQQQQQQQHLFKTSTTTTTTTAPGTLVLHHGPHPTTDVSPIQSQSQSQSQNRHADTISDAANTNGSIPAAHSPSENAGFSSPTRSQMEREYGPGLLPVAQVNDYPNALWKQDLVPKIRENEEEIMQLRKHLSDYSVKEAQIRNEKLVLEKRIAYMRLAFDQQQQDLVDAASKALSYRQDIIEENIRLTYALQDAQQERTTFISSLLPLLAEYSLQPPVADAQSIVSNVKVLFKHLQEKLVLTESKLKESQYQLTPWRSDVNHSNVAPPSLPHSIGTALATSRTSSAQDLLTQAPISRGDTHVNQYGEGTANKQVTFHDPVRNSDMDDEDAEGNPNEREIPTNWSSGNPPYTTTLDDPSSSFSPFLPPVLEEPSSSFSEAADDDPLPAIHELQISGEAYPGRELQACGYSINGTTSCNFEWVRHLEDGSVNYIDGAKQPNYLVTADDVDTYLAIEVQPLDNRKRKGELVKVFANENKKITCDPEMQNHIEKTLHSGHASFKVLVSTGYLDFWEQATLAIKRDAYSIKGSGSSSVVHTEKFSPNTNATIPYGSLYEFLITGSSGVEYLLKADNSSDISCARDTIVLTLRLFILRASERRKGKKRVLFFNK